MYNIAFQILGKTRKVLWKAETPQGIPEHTMIIGADVFHNTRNNKASVAYLVKEGRARPLFWDRKPSVSSFCSDCYLISPSSTSRSITQSRPPGQGAFKPTRAPSNKVCGKQAGV